ncbi:uncharacterized protein LOC144446060 [Glandiceps talaboti]
MKTLKRKFARSNIRKSFQKWSREDGNGARMSKNMELLMFLEYTLFLQKLADQANEKAQENKEKSVTTRHVDSVLENVLKSFSS